MIDDRIGTIGSTHGVSDSSAPSPKNSSITDHRLPLASTAWIRSSSRVGAAVTARRGGATALASGTVGAAASESKRTGRLVTVGG